jgi:hypothetical protein
MSKIIRYNNFKLDSLTYKKPVNQNNIYVSSIDYESDKCLIQTPKMIFKGIKEDPTTKQKYLVMSPDPNDFEFYDLLVKLDDHNLSQTYKLSKDWFNKELPMDVLENMYRPISKPFLKNDIPEITIKVPFLKGTMQCKMYDKFNNPIIYDKLNEGSTIMCILHINGLKFLKKDYYCDNYITQIKLCENPSYETCLIEDTDSIDESKYDYEIIDEEIIQRNTEILAYREQIHLLEHKIKVDQSELLIIKDKLNKL